MEEVKPEPLQEGDEDSNGMQHPRTGLGHPEPLVGGNDVTYSRHITAHDRIIYDIYDNLITVLVVQAEEHYNDK